MILLHQVSLESDGSQLEAAAKSSGLSRLKLETPSGRHQSYCCHRIVLAQLTRRPANELNSIGTEKV